MKAMSEPQAPQDQLIRELRKQNEELLQKVQELQDKIEELEDQLAKSRRAGKRQAAPFSRGKKKAKPKKPGRKKGHPGAKRERPEHVDHTLEAPPLNGCGDCGGDLVETKKHENFQADLPPIRPKVTRFAFESGWCETCRKRVFSRHPEQISTAVGAASSHLGPRVLGLIADWKNRLGLPLRKISGILEDQFGLEVTAGALAQANARLARRGRPTFDALGEALARESLVHADETGWRVNASSWWLWVICSQSLTYFQIVAHRRATVVADVLGQEFPGLLMRDGWSSYDARMGCRMLRCLVHLLRNAEEREDKQSGEAAEDMGSFVLWLKGVFFLRERASELTEGEYRAEAAELLTWFNDFVAADHVSEINQDFAERLAEMRDHVLPLVEDPKLPATNNHAERQIRPAVIHRKTSAGNKTESGAETLAILASLATSCRQQGRSFTEWIGRLLTRSPGEAVPFWPPPDPAPT